jgi:hypothetical protein
MMNRKGVPRPTCTPNGLHARRLGEAKDRRTRFGRWLSWLSQSALNAKLPSATHSSKGLIAHQKVPGQFSATA